MLTQLRKEVQAAFAAIPTGRKPALRRASQKGALLATDLPLTAGEEAVRAFAAVLAQQGWTVVREGMWLLLDHPMPVPQAYILPQTAGEAACCLWLLTHHPNAELDTEMLRDLVKAADAGKQYMERLCAAWHRDFAARLRNKQSLPGGLLPYLCEAMKEEEA